MDLLHRPPLRSQEDSVGKRRAPLVLLSRVDGCCAAAVPAACPAAPAPWPRCRVQFKREKVRWTRARGRLWLVAGVGERTCAQADSKCSPRETDAREQLTGVRS